MDESSKRKKTMEALAEKLKRAFVESENNLMVIQNTSHHIKDIENRKQREYLEVFYSQCRNAKEFALATLIKGIFMQNKLFFSTSQGSLKRAVNLDPDNTFKHPPKLSRITAHMHNIGFEQLWDGVRSAIPKYRKTAGFVVDEPKIRSLLDVDNALAKQQYLELKAYCSNDWFTEDLVFDSGGELRVKSGDIRAKIVERRTESSESRHEIVELGEEIDDGGKSLKESLDRVYEGFDKANELEDLLELAKLNERSLSADDFNSSATSSIVDRKKLRSDSERIIDAYTFELEHGGAYSDEDEIEDDEEP